jgi:hypothetical protein
LYIPYVQCEQGYAILKTDFTNGFNALSRQAVLDAVQKRCPELTSLFNLFYTVDGAGFFIVEGSVEIVWSAEGVRQGCPFGSFGFDLALQDTLERCAKNSDVVVRAITDDANLAVRIPSDRVQAVEVLERLRAALAGLEKDAKQNLNLELNRGKCALLLPPGHPLLPGDLEIFQDVKLPANGMRVAGAPIGDDNYCADFVKQKVTAAVAKCCALKGLDPQVAMLLLRRCCAPLLNFLAQVVPPSLTIPHFTRFDEELAELTLELLSLSSNGYAYPPASMVRACWVSTASGPPHSSALSLVAVTLTRAFLITLLGCDVSQTRLLTCCAIA